MKGGASKKRKAVSRGGDGEEGTDGWMCLGMVPVSGWGDLWARHQGGREADGL